MKQRLIKLLLDEKDLQALEYVRAEFQLAEDTEAKTNKRLPQNRGINETIIATIHIAAKVLNAERRLHQTNEKGENENESK